MSERAAARIAGTPARLPASGSPTRLVATGTPTGLVATGVVLSAVLLSACGSPDAASAQDWQTMTSARNSAGEDALNASVEYGAGTLTLGAAATGTLYRSELRYDASAFTPRMEYENGRLRIGMSSANVRGRNIRGGELDVALSPDVPLELSLQFGAAEATLELGGLRLRRLEVQTGASRTNLAISMPNPEPCREARFQVGAARFEATGLGNLNAAQLNVDGGVGDMTLDFTGDWPRDMTANVAMGLGSLTLRMQRGVGVRLNRSGALTSFDGQELVRRDNSYYSQDWDSAERKLTLNLSAALGSVRVVWVDS